MLTIVLKILGGIFLLLLLAGAFFAFKLWRGWRGLIGAAKALGGAETPPVIHLIPDQEPEWTEKPAVREIIAEAQKWGLAPGRPYEVDEMTEVYVLPLFSTGDQGPAAGVIYDHPSAGNWLDLVVMYEDGHMLTISNAPHGGELDVPPNSTKLFFEGESAERLFQEMVERFEAKQVLYLRPQNFVAEFERAYREEMEWRLERGVTEDEVRRVAEHMGQEATEEEIQQTVGVIKADQAHDLHHLWRTHFIESTDMSVAEWIEAEEGLFFVSDRHSVDQLVDYLECTFELTEEQADWLRSASDSSGVRAAFAQLNADLAPEKQARALGAIQQPIAADVYTSRDGLDS